MMWMEINQKKVEDYRPNLLYDVLSRPAGIIGVFLISVHLIVAVFSPFFVPYDYKEINALIMMQEPSELYWLGTDHLGRDIFSRTLLGGREAILVTGIATPLAVIWGGLLGIYFGLVGGRIDEILMRFVDAFLSLPWILKMLVLIVTFGFGNHQIIRKIM